MRGVSTGLIVCLLAASVLAGCIDGPEGVAPEVNNDNLDELRLQEDWSYETAGGGFRYEGGRFTGTYDGDQLVLKVNLSEPLEIAEFSWSWKYTLEYEESWSPVFAMWNLEDPWPTVVFFAHTITEWGTIKADIAGITVEQEIGHPQRTVQSLVGINDEPRTYEETYTATEPIHLEPGEYRFWFGVPKSQGMRISITLPEDLVLSEPPQFSHGCAIVQPSDFESDLLIQEPLVGRVTDHAQWTTDLDVGEAILGYWYSFDGASGISEKRYHHPDGTQWTYERDPTGTQAEPSDWGGGRITSRSPGAHILEHRGDITIRSGGPVFVHCIQ